MIKYLIAALGLFLSQMANGHGPAPNFYGGVGYAYSGYKTELEADSAIDLDYSHGNFKALLGFGPSLFADNADLSGDFSIELQYLNFGGDAEIDLDGGGSADVDVDGHSFGIAVVYHFNDVLFAKLGLHRWELEFDENNAPEDDIDLLLGLGYQVKLPDSDVAVRLEYEALKIPTELFEGEFAHNFGVSFVFGF